MIPGVGFNNIIFSTQVSSVERMGGEKVESVLSTNNKARMIEVPKFEATRVLQYLSCFSQVIRLLSSLRYP